MKTLLIYSLAFAFFAVQAEEPDDPFNKGKKTKDWISDDGEPSPYTSEQRKRADKASEEALALTNEYLAEMEALYRKYYDKLRVIREGYRDLPAELLEFGIDMKIRNFEGSLDQGWDDAFEKKIIQELGSFEHTKWEILIDGRKAIMVSLKSGGDTVLEGMLPSFDEEKHMAGCKWRQLSKSMIELDFTETERAINKRRVMIQLGHDNFDQLTLNGERTVNGINSIRTEQTGGEFPWAFGEGNHERCPFIGIGDMADECQVLPAEVFDEEDAREVGFLSRDEADQRPVDGGGDGLGDTALARSGKAGEGNGPWHERAVLLEQGQVLCEPCLERAETGEILEGIVHGCLGNVTVRSIMI